MAAALPVLFPFRSLALAPRGAVTLPVADPREVVSQHEAAEEDRHGQTSSVGHEEEQEAGDDPKRDDEQEPSGNTPVRMLSVSHRRHRHGASASRSRAAAGHASSGIPAAPAGRGAVRSPGAPFLRDAEASARGSVHSYPGIFNLRRLAEFRTTVRELNAMAAAAMTGFRRPTAARGIEPVLYASAQNKFCRILRIVALLSLIPAGTSWILSLISTRPPVSLATSEPEPRAMPRSAVARAGASLIPSPTMATMSPSALRRRMTSAFPSGRTFAMTRSMPTREAMALAVRSLSPVRRRILRPMSLRDRTAASDWGFTVSARARTPRNRPSTTRFITVFPWDSRRSHTASAEPNGMPSSRSSVRLPTRTPCPPTV